MAVSKKFKHDIVRDTLRKLLDLDTDEMDREMMKHLLDAGRCPTEFPELGIDDCPSLSELGGVREVRQLRRIMCEAAQSARIRRLARMINIVGSAGLR